MVKMITTCIGLTLKISNTNSQIRKFLYEEIKESTLLQGFEGEFIFGNIVNNP